MLTAEDFALRRTGLTATDITVLAGVTPYGRTPHDVYLDKTGEIAPRAPSAAQSLGHRLEPVALAILAEERELVVLRGKSEAHPMMPWVISTPDGDVLTKPTGGVRCAVAEAKAVGLHMASRWGESGDPDGVPDEVLVQVTWQCIQRRVSLAHVVALIGTDARFYDIEKNEDLAAGLLELGEGWWRRHVLGKRAPDVDGSEGAARMVRGLFRKATKGIVPAPAEAAGLVDRYLETKAARESAEREEDAAKARLCALIGEAEGIDGETYLATWRERAGSPDWKALAEKLGATPQLAKEYRRDGTRVLNVKLKTGKAA